MRKLSGTFTVAALAALLVGSLAAQNLESFRDIQNRLSIQEDQRNPDRIVERGFNALFDGRAAVSEILRASVNLDFEQAAEQLSAARASTQTSIAEFEALKGSDAISPDVFGTVVFKRGSARIVLSDFDDTLGFLLEGLYEFDNALALMIEAGVTAARLERALLLGQQLERDAASYFGLSSNEG